MRYDKIFHAITSANGLFWFYSFQFEWPRFSESFHRDACQMLDAALNKGNKPPIIADRIEVVELEMGKQVCSYLLPIFLNIFAKWLLAPGTRDTRHWRPHYGPISRDL